MQTPLQHEVHRTPSAGWGRGGSVALTKRARAVAVKGFKSGVRRINSITSNPVAASVFRPLVAVNITAFDKKKLVQTAVITAIRIYVLRSIIRSILRFFVAGCFLFWFSR